MLSKKTKYALQAVMVLTREYQKGPVLISEIAGQENIPQKFLEAILLQLKNRGILGSKKGKGGGYFLGRPPEKITFGEIVRMMDGPLAPVPCVSETAYMPCTECNDERTCGIRMVMKEVREALAEILDSTTFRDAHERVNKTVHDLAISG